MSTITDDAYWNKLDEQVALTTAIKATHSGLGDWNGVLCRAVVEWSNDYYVFQISEILKLDLDDCVFELQTDKYRFIVTGMVTGERNTVNHAEGWHSRHSAGKVDHFCTAGWLVNGISRYRSFYDCGSDRLIRDFFGFQDSFEFNLNQTPYRLLAHGRHVVVEVLRETPYEIYSENVYNIMVAIGFVTGKFIQEHNYTFQLREDDLSSEWLYRRLRSGSSSMYHALTWNAYGYKHLLGQEKADIIYDSKILKPLDTDVLGRLAQLSNNRHAIQYALVLFNEANSDKLSLLVKNSCFYTVLEVLRKYFYQVFKPRLPENYSNLGNIPKFKAVFSQLVSLSDTEEAMLKRRNAILHGEVDDIGGTEMIALMQMQISLIYRLLLAYTGFDGYVINHYALRNQLPDQAFIKLGQADPKRS